MQVKLLRQTQINDNAGEIVFFWFLSHTNVLCIICTVKLNFPSHDNSTSFSDFLKLDKLEHTRPLSQIKPTLNHPSYKTVEIIFNFPVTWLVFCATCS